MNRYWFRPKRFGYGATPITWEGWVFTLAGAVLILVLVREALTIPDRNTALTVAGFGTLIVGLVMSAISRRKTDGEWKWRSGRNE